jgi:hypothetical protein
MLSLTISLVEQNTSIEPIRYVKKYTLLLCNCQKLITLTGGVEIHRLPIVMILPLRRER